MAALDPITGAETLIDDALNKFIPDPVAAAAAKAQVLQIMTTAATSALQAQAQIITAEANNSNKLASSWRPMLMYCFILILFNNYFLAPYLQALFSFSVTLSIPAQMWSLLNLGVGGYIMGRSVEKITSPHPVTGVSPLTSTVQSVANIFKGA